MIPLTPRAFSHSPRPSSATRAARSWWLRCALLPLALSTLALTAPQARAQTQEEEAQQQAVSRAQRLIEKGKRHFQDREYMEGIEAYSEAQRLLPDPKNLYVIATAYGYIPEACARTLEAWERFFAECGECDYRENAKKTLSEQRLRCVVTLSVEGGTPGLRVSHKGEDWGAAPLKRDLVAAEYPGLGFSASGYLPHSVDLTLKQNERLRALTVRLVPDLKPSFLDANRPFLGGVTGVLSLTSLIFAITQASAAADLVSSAERINGERGEARSEARAEALALEYIGLSKDLDSVQAGLWVGVSGALLFGGLSAWLWLREPDVKIDPSARPEVSGLVSGLSSLRFSVGPGGGAVGFSF